MQTSNLETQDRIVKVVRSILEDNGIEGEIGVESLLVDLGLTSMDMVDLMLGVEAEFDLTIPQAEITPENFRSVKTLEQMLIAQLEPGTAV